MWELRARSVVYSLQHALKLYIDEKGSAIYQRTLEKTFSCQNYLYTAISLPSISPETSGKCSARVTMQEVDGEAFESVAFWHRPPHCVLELLITTGDACAAFQLIGWQRRGQQVGEMVIPDCPQLQVLENKKWSVLHVTVHFQFSLEAAALCISVRQRYSLLLDR